MSKTPISVWQICMTSFDYSFGVVFNWEFVSWLGISSPIIMSLIYKAEWDLIVFSFFVFFFLTLRIGFYSVINTALFCDTNQLIFLQGFSSHFAMEYFSKTFFEFSYQIIILLPAIPHTCAWCAVKVLPTPWCKHTNSG